ncbi:MAG: hypothetical protein ACKPCM_14440 [Pseudanabaena sp.]
MRVLSIQVRSPSQPNLRDRRSHFCESQIVFEAGLKQPNGLVKPLQIIFDF